MYKGVACHERFLAFWYQVFYALPFVKFDNKFCTDNINILRVKFIVFLNFNSTKTNNLYENFTRASSTIC